MVFLVAIFAATISLNRFTGFVGEFLGILILVLFMKNNTKVKDFRFVVCISRTLLTKGLRPEAYPAAKGLPAQCLSAVRFLALSDLGPPFRLVGKMLVTVV
jgi:hypothetical protein